MPRRRMVELFALAALGSATLSGCGGSAGDESGDRSRTQRRTRTVVETTTVQAQAELAPTAAIAPATTSPGIGSTSDLTGIVRPFAPNSPWNTEVLGEAVAPNSSQLLRDARRRVGAVDTGLSRATATQDVLLNDPLFINIRRWTTPVVDETNGVATPIYCRQPPLPPLPSDEQTVPDERALCGDGWAVDSLLVPPNESPRPEYDGWFTVLNRAEGVAYDLWRARRASDGSSISYQFLRRWDLNGPGFLAPGRVSARGSGLPLFAGLILPEEVRAGRIDHALAISVPAPAQRVYVQPASSTDGVGRVTSLPEGARLRLKRSVTLRSIQGRYRDPRCANPLFGLRDGSRRRLCDRPEARFRFLPRTNRRAAGAIIDALHRYGAIVVDRSRVPTLYAKLNADWTEPLRGEAGQLLDEDGRPFARGERREPTPLLRGNELQGIRLTDFEVLRLGETLRFPALGRITVAPLPGGAVGESATTPAPPPGTRTTPTTTATTPTTRQTFAPQTTTATSSTSPAAEGGP